VSDTWSAGTTLIYIYINYLLQVWNVKVSLHILEIDGNILDTALLSATISLLKSKRKYAEVISDKHGSHVKVYDETERYPVSMNMNYIPISTCFAILRDEAVDTTGTEDEDMQIDSTNTVIFTDPTTEELEASSSSLSVISNVHGEICGIYTNGIVESDILMRSCLEARKRAEILTRTVRESLQ
jgi:exosome complex RNA-binding protein Rrp42 (RNase PH superfamily)